MIEFDNVVSCPAYYLEEPNQIRTEFRGKGARLLGIEGTFDEATFHRLFRGMQPGARGRQGSQARPAHRGNRRGAFDITLNMPKTASIQQELAGDTRIAGVMDRAQAVVQTMLEQQVRVRVRKESEIAKSKAKQPKGWKYPERHSGNLVFVAFAHPSSREGDPHAHRHLFVPNLTYDRHERMWKAVEFRHIDRKAIAEAYRSELMKGLNGSRVQDQAGRQGVRDRRRACGGQGGSLPAEYPDQGNGRPAKQDRSAPTHVTEPCGHKVR